MNSNVKQIIEDNLDLINENDFNKLYQKVSIDYRGELSYVLLTSGIDFLSYMNYVPAYAFFISTVKKINIPENIKSIEAYAFYGCTGLTSITIPDNVTSIGGSAFWNCTGLKSVTIPSSVKSIDWQAFSDCNNLRDINFKGTKKKFLSIEIGSDAIPDKVTVHCTDGDFIYEAL